MSDTIFVTPRAGLSPRLDETTVVGPAGAAVAPTRLVRRMIAAGDLIETPQPAPAKSGARPAKGDA